MSRAKVLCGVAFGALFFRPYYTQIRRWHNAVGALSSVNRVCGLRGLGLHCRRRRKSNAVFCGFLVSAARTKPSTSSTLRPPPSNAAPTTSVAHRLVVWTCRTCGSLIWATGTRTPFFRCATSSPQSRAILCAKARSLRLLQADPSPTPVYPSTRIMSRSMPVAGDCSRRAARRPSWTWASVFS